MKSTKLHLLIYLGYTAGYGVKYVSFMAFLWIKRWWITARNESAELSNIWNEYASEYIPQEQIRGPEQIRFYTVIAGNMTPLVRTSWELCELHESCVFLTL